MSDALPKKPVESNQTMYKEREENQQLWSTKNCDLVLKSVYKQDMIKLLHKAYTTWNTCEAILQNILSVIYMHSILKGYIYH